MEIAQDKICAVFFVEALLLLVAFCNAFCTFKFLMKNPPPTIITTQPSEQKWENIKKYKFKRLWKSEIN